ncbi:MAG: hypothetical protein IKU62_06675 [Ruminiclostridium sp.]|nr:hypothetical protein [Ruminiclostridium sp.]
MASTNKTSNLRLNQWEGSDPILRTDFNQDNSKIDQAVNARALVRLTGKNLTASTGTITVDLLDYDLTQYEALELTLAPITSAAGTTSLTVGNTSPVSLASMAADGSRGLVVHLQFLPGGVGGWWFAPGLATGNTGGFLAAGVTASDLEEVKLSSASAPYQAGTAWTLYGLKK